MKTDMHAMDDGKIAPCAEVTESTLDTFTAYCWRWDVVPPFGSLVMTTSEQYVLYGVVYSSKTESLDPMHTMHVYKKTEEEMRKEYPHLFDFLKTTFEVLVLGYQKEEQIFYRRSPFPARLYSFVSLLDRERLRNFFLKPDFLDRLTREQSSMSHYEELLLTLILQQKKLGLLTDQHITKYVCEYGHATQARYNELQNFIEKVENF